MRLCSSWSRPLIPMTVPLSGTATISPNGVPRFCLGMVSPPTHDSSAIGLQEFPVLLAPAIEHPAGDATEFPLAVRFRPPIACLDGLNPVQCGPIFVRLRWRHRPVSLHGPHTL